MLAASLFPAVRSPSQSHVAPLTMASRTTTLIRLSPSSPGRNPPFVVPSSNPEEDVDVTIEAMLSASRILIVCGELLLVLTLSFS